MLMSADGGDDGLPEVQRRSSHDSTEMPELDTCAQQLAPTPLPTDEESDGEPAEPVAEVRSSHEIARS